MVPKKMETPRRFPPDMRRSNPAAEPEVPSEDHEPASPEPRGDLEKQEAPQKDVPHSGKRMKEMDKAVKDPTVKVFMDTFKARVLSVESLSRGEDTDK